MQTSLPEVKRDCGDGSTVDENAVSNISARDVELASTELVVDSPLNRSACCSSTLVLFHRSSEFELSSIL